MGYKLELYKKDGSESTHHHDDPRSLEYDAADCAFNSNVISIVAKEDTPFGKTLFGWSKGRNNKS